MFTSETVAYIISISFSALTILTAFIIAKYYKSNAKTFSKPLQLYLSLCCLPFCLLFLIATSTASIIHFINGFISLAVEEVITYVLEFSCQMFRNVFIFLLIERILATIFYDKYVIQNKFTFYWSLTGISFGITILYILIIKYYINSPNVQTFVKVKTFYVFFIHSITIFACIVLRILNKRMYKVTAYRISLKQRHQMLENVKFLAFMLPPIFLHTLITPIGTLISVISIAFNFNALSPSIYHIFYVLSLWVICVRRIIVTRENETKVVKITFVKNAFGKSLPTAVTTDKYFQELQLQWKK